MRIVMTNRGILRAFSLAAALGALAASCPALAGSGVTKVTVQYENPICNQNYPELVYWFVTPETLSPAQYKNDIAHIAHDTKFTFPFLTARNGVNFLDNPEAHAAVAGIVKDAHENGLRVGVTLLGGGAGGAKTSIAADEQTVIADGETTLGAQGDGTVQVSVELRGVQPTHTELLRAYTFRKTGAGEYDPSTLADVTAEVKSASPEQGTLTVNVQLGSLYDGYTIFVLAKNSYPVMDMFSTALRNWLRSTVDQYRDIPLDGAALDEFGYVRIPMNPTAPWRGHFAGRAFAERFRATTGVNLARALFDTRYAPEGHPEVRIRAIDEYWDFLRSGPLEEERDFYNYSRHVFGEKEFAGIHNTFHNHLTNDEAWATGIDWWTIPRQYGMSDEDLSLPLRMGLLVSHPGNIMYDQFYGWDIHRFAEKAMNDARFDARIHYHGYNDTGRWGVNLASEAFLTQLNPVEQKIRLLNRFDPAAPELPLLVVFGMPRLLNWYPDERVRNVFDVNDSLHIEEKAQAIWDAGYRCAVVPSDLIDNGWLKLDAYDRPVVNGHTFRALVYLYPEYAKQSTLHFLDEYTRRGGALMLEGDATRDFDGVPVGSEFAKIAARARVRGFNVDKLPELGVPKSPLDGTGGELEDGSVVLTDLNSLETEQPKSFTVQVNGHTFSGAYVGVFALKAAKNGMLEKLACGECRALRRDGREVLSLRTPSDIVLKRNATGQYYAVIQGAPGSNAIRLLR
jgi:hypothetical protein